jgi:hypothetical protein
MKTVACVVLIGALGLVGCGGDDDGGGIDIGADAGPSGACNPVSQMGCAAGQKCGFVLLDPATGASGAACIADGTQALGAECTRPMAANETDNCVAGSWCFDGKCVGMCSDTSLAGCQQNEACVSVNMVDGFGACLPNCDPLNQTGTCPSGQGCYLAGGGAVCAGSAGVAVGEPCEFINSCAPGGVCLGEAGASKCRQFCGDFTLCLVDDGANIEACGDCNGKLTTACPLDEACFPIGDGMGGAAHPQAGACLGEADTQCSCAASPICPPAM